jgi:hypothetical protein
MKQEGVGEVQLEALDLRLAAERLVGEELYRHSAKLLSHHVSVTYALDMEEHRRRRRLGLGALMHERTLACLLELPINDLAVVDRRFESLRNGILRDTRLLTLIEDPDGHAWGRRLLAVPVRPVQVTISARSWKSAISAAHRWSGYAERVVVLENPRGGQALMATEAAHYGVGLVLGSNPVVEPRRFSPRRFTPAKWRLAEEIYSQFLEYHMDV